MTEPGNEATEHLDAKPPDDFEEGWVSSYDAQSAIGFIRPTATPTMLVRYLQQNLGKDLENVLEVGQQVWFKKAVDDVQKSSNRRWDIASEVRIPWNDSGKDDMLDGS